MIIAIVGQCYNHMSVNAIIKADFIIVTMWIVGSLVFDWIQIKNDNAKDKNSKG